MKFYLQFGNTETEVSSYRANNGRTTVSEPRAFIDDHMHKLVFDNKPTIPTTTLIQEFEAPNWLDARMQAEAYVI